MASTNTSRAPKATAAQRLRELLADSNRIIVAPGVYEGISARIALSLGFDALYMV
jgi:methylisocitrate lyase